MLLPNPMYSIPYTAPQGAGTGLLCAPESTLLAWLSTAVFVAAALAMYSRAKEVFEQLRVPIAAFLRQIHAPLLVEGIFDFVCALGFISIIDAAGPAEVDAESSWDAFTGFGLDWARAGP